MTLAKQINKWYQAGEHQETVNAILNMAEMEVTDNLIEDLAVAYNNLGQYQKAVEALKNTGFQNRTSPHWHYCMGYALYYAAMDSPGFKKQKALLEGAFHAFSCALKLQPEKNLAHECREFLSWIEDDLQKPDSPPYDMEQEGIYRFTPVLPHGYRLSEGVVLPEIMVTVKPEGDTIEENCMEKVNSDEEGGIFYAEDADVLYAGDADVLYAEDADILLAEGDTQLIKIAAGQSETWDERTLRDVTVIVEERAVLTITGFVAISGNTSSIIWLMVPRLAVLAFCAISEITVR